MSAALDLRDDFDAAGVRALAARSSDARQSRRLLSIAAIYDGMSRKDAARIGGMDRQTLRDWVIRFNESGADGLVDRKSPGRKRRLSAAQMMELDALVAAGPDPVVDGVVRWRIRDLQRLIEDRFGVCYKERAISNLLKALGFSRMSGRPQHPKQDQRVLEAFKKTGQRRSPPT